MFIIWQKRIQELLSSQEVGSYDILNDPLTKVFGVDMRGRVRGVGNNVSRTQIVSSAPALEKLSAKEKNVNEQTSEIKDLKDQVMHPISELGSIKQLIEVTIYWSYWIFYRYFSYYYIFKKYELKELQKCF